MDAKTEQLLKAVTVEAFRSRKVIVGAFLALNLLAIAIGLSWPESYVATTSILVQERNILQPLMQGTAVPTEVMNRARVAREVIYSRRVMNRVIESLGMVGEDASEARREREARNLIANTSVQPVPAQGIIRLEYKDKDPERAYQVIAKIAEAFIAESLGAKAAESTSAFEFIDKQVHEYQEKLVKTEEALKQFRSSNVDARVGSEADVNTRISQLQTTIEQTERQVRETEVRKTSIERQLAGEAETASALSREDQYRARISELRAQLETLRLSYHDTYPDIIRLKNQIEDLKEAAAAEQARRAAARSAGQPMVDESVLSHSPIYQQLRQQLLQTRTEIDTLNARIAEAKRQIRDEQERGKRVAGGESTLAELTRDYQVTRDLYQDLLRRRENARVSMNMDSEQQGLGLTFRINEPPSRPNTPKGPQFIHIAIVGFLLSLGLPFGAVFALVKFDPRIRLRAALEDRFKLPILASIPQRTSAAEVLVVRAEMARLGLAVGLAIVAVVVVIVMRMTHIV